MNIFTRLPISVPTSIGEVSSNDIMTYAQYLENLQLEQGAYAHWDFSDGLTASNGKQLAPQAAADYSISQGRLLFNTKKGGALLSDKAGAAPHTICLVVKIKSGYTGTTTTQLAGTVSGSNGQAMVGFDPANGGVNGYVVGGGFGSSPRLTANLDGWQFISVSIPSGSSPNILTIAADTIRGLQESSKVSTVAVTVSEAKIALGNGYFDGVGYVTAQIECAEFILFETAKTASEIKDIYQRSKSRMRLKNISI